MRIDRLVLNQDTILRSIGLLLVLHCLSSGFWLPSQSSNAPLIGIVADPIGAVIPGTSASIIPAASQAAATGTADGLGSYHTRGLNPGSHIVTVSAPGSLIGGFFGNSTAGNRSIIFKTEFNS